MTDKATIIVLLATNIVMFILFLHSLGRAARWRKLAFEAKDLISRWQAEIVTQNSTAHNFVNTCRLIMVNREGRTIAFTFQRGDDIFNVVAMATWDTLDTDEIRERAGLT